MTLLKTNWVATNTGHVAEHNLIGSKLNRMVSLLDYGGNGDGATDNATALTNTIAALVAAGGGTIYFPIGIYRFNTNVRWASNINMLGEGIGNSVLLPYGGAQILGDAGGLATPYTDCFFQDIELDGINQTGWTKGFFMQYCKRFHFLRVYAHDTGATGFGNDYMVDSIYDSCIAEGCGRTQTVNDPGCSGFGVGTGKYQVEVLTLANCISRNNKRYGAFFEVQGNPATEGVFRSRGIKVIGGYYEGNQWGIGDCGVDGLVISGASINDNVAEGFYNGGPSLGNYEGTNGIIAGCEIARNGADGIEPDAPNGYILSGNNVHNNG